MLGSDLITYLNTQPHSYVVGLDMCDVDLSKPNAISTYFKTHDIEEFPTIVINCAAFTDTTACGDFLSENYRKAYAANVLIPKYAARFCRQHHIRFVHISTDYVYSQNVAHDDLAERSFEFPVNAYGLQKLLGEKSIAEEFMYHESDYIILRTSWLYSKTHPKATFIYKFIANCYKSVFEDNYDVDVVSDCVGRPTDTEFLSKLIVRVINEEMFGIYDAQNLNSLSTFNSVFSRYQWAQAIVKKWSDIDESFKNIKLKPKYQSEFKNSTIIHPTYVPEIFVGNAFFKDLYTQIIEELSSSTLDENMNQTLTMQCRRILDYVGSTITGIKAKTHLDAVKSNDDLSIAAFFIQHMEI